MCDRTHYNALHILASSQLCTQRELSRIGRMLRVRVERQRTITIAIALVGLPMLAGELAYGVLGQHTPMLMAGVVTLFVLPLLVAGRLAILDHITVVKKLVDAIEALSPRLEDPEKGLEPDCAKRPGSQKVSDRKRCQDV